METSFHIAYFHWLSLTGSVFPNVDPDTFVLYEIYSGDGSYVYVYCVVCYSVTAAPCVRSAGIYICILLNSLLKLE